ncbi:hypothetical protein [Mycobacterium sp. 141]|uniref:hypothetical protein n=1 Tax=Mycobacterium sp. 141 TaxID=1120797 RepID=UPI0018C9287E|nr:hypothetical protein [Mycobacterium sp. 141]
MAYRNANLLRECLAAAHTHLPGIPVYVWDNSGPDYAGADEMTKVVAEYPDVHWYLGSANIGFAAAVNALTREVPDYDFILLNPDAILQGPLTDTLAAIQCGGVAAASPLTIEHDTHSKHRRSWDTAHREQSLSRALVAWSGYATKIRGSRCSDLYERRPDIVEGYLTGACLAVSRDAWDRVGNFDEEFFLYGEEADWQRRARSAGWSLRLVDEPGIVHTGHGTVAGDPTAGLRSQDLLRANIALNLEFENGRRCADAFLVGSTVLDRVQRSVRRARTARRRPPGARPSVLITMNQLTSAQVERQHALLAAELDRRGYEVIIVCVGRFGPPVSMVTPSVRVIRQTWWLPLIDTAPGQSVVISGSTPAETGFATLWRAANRSRRWLVAAPPSSPNNPRCSRAHAVAMHRCDGAVTVDGVLGAGELDNGLAIDGLADTYESAIAEVLR